jgi:hypothetical protein
MINADRVKIAVLMDGRSVISDIQEAVHKETGERQAWVFNYPYAVTYDQPKLEGTGITMDPDVKVYYEPWNPLTTDVQVAINPQFVVTIMEPQPSLRDTYVANVVKMLGDVE